MAHVMHTLNTFSMSPPFPFTHNPVEIPFEFHGYQQAMVFYFKTLL